MKTDRLLEAIDKRGVKITVSDGDIVLYGNKRRITTRLINLVRQCKSELIDALKQRSTGVEIQFPTKPHHPSSRGPECAVRTPRGGVEYESQPHRPTAHQLLYDALGLDPDTAPMFVPWGNDQRPFTIWTGNKLVGQPIAIDTETTPIRDHDVPRLVLASVSDGVDHHILPRDRLAEFLHLHRRRHFVAHHMPFDAWVIADHLGPDADVWWRIGDRGGWHCTQVLEQLLRLAKRDEPPRNHSLADLSKTYLSLELFGKDDPRRQGFEDIQDEPLDTIDPWFLQYAAQDAIATAKIHRLQRGRARTLQPKPAKLLPDAVKRFGLLSESLQVRGAVALQFVERNGMHLDPTGLEASRRQLRQELFQTAEELETKAPDGLPILQRYKQERCITAENQGYRLNGSGYPKIIQDNVRQVFAQVAADHDLDAPKSKNGKLSLTKDYWQDHRDLHPVIDRFLDVQAKGKTYSFFATLNGDHIHPRYIPMVRSGRVSCRNPNVQQMPRAGNVREMFVPRPGHALFAIDYSALELRTLAAVCLHLYDKSTLADVINSGTDPHAHSYCRIHGMALDEFQEWKHREPGAAKAARDAIKGVTFGVPGSMQPAGLVEYVKKAYGQRITVETATEYRDRLMREVYPEWDRYLAQTGPKAITLTGRVRGRLRRPGQLFNTAFQGLAGDGAKETLWRLMRAGYRVVAFIHDEFLIELPTDQDNTQAAADIERICCQAMAEFTPGVKIATEYTLADRWSKSAERVIKDGQLRMWSPEEHHGADCHCDDCYSVRERDAIASAETAPAAEVQEAPDQAVAEWEKHINTQPRKAKQLLGSAPKQLSSRRKGGYDPDSIWSFVDPGPDRVQQAMNR